MTNDKDSRATGASPAAVGHFQLDGPIGAGGMGWVFRAIDTRSGSVVALKLIHPHVAATPGFRARFEQGVEAGRRFAGVNAVRQLDAGEIDGRFYIAMEYVAGPTLRAALGNGPIPEARAARIGQQIAVALQEAEALGVVHRDLKPENVLIDAGDAVKVADFGIARVDDLEGVTPTEGILGSAAYLAPERAAGQADHRSDIYSAGIVLYEMVTGRTPFEGGVLAQLDQHRATPVPTAPLGHVSAGLRATILRCLEKRPEARYPRALDLAADLSDAGPRRRSGLGSSVAVGLPAALLGALAVAGIVAALSDSAPAAPRFDSSLVNFETPVPGPPPRPAS